MTNFSLILICSKHKLENVLLLRIYVVLFLAKYHSYHQYTNNDSLENEQLVIIGLLHMIIHLPEWWKGSGNKF